MALFNNDSYQKSATDWLTVALKYDNHGGGRNTHPGSWDEVRMTGLLRTLSINWT